MHAFYFLGKSNLHKGEYAWWGWGGLLQQVSPVVLAHGFLGQVVGQVAEGRRGPWAAPADLLIPLRCAFPPPPASSAGTFTVGAISGLIIFSRPLIPVCVCYCEVLQLFST